MDIGSDRWLRLVRDGAAQLGVSVSREQAMQFARHGQWLMEWNRKINLTAITDPKEVAIKHFIDAIAPLNHIPDGGHLLDIGTGGGFPGIALKIMRPDQSMTLIDGVRKKINFVKYVIRQLSLDQIFALHQRAEALSGSTSEAGKFAVIVCRALADPLAAVGLAQPLLTPNGRIVLYQGPHTTTDSAWANGSRLSYHGISCLRERETICYQLPYSNMKRRVIILDARH
jgi:16S rRNA (guanine527-N7)-methyltransferase